ncbi:fibrobacter succinogenes major paralogous domain-containing protein [Photobacterium sp. DNB23_23_1]|uniref:Fibrobacter succinogenes major paralogous domain-containing protein n=1 Tax=Photobacterium pectinilyticum TaxID=2906793 RepID=A0ABT1MYR4_9GAMM|nr:fibrobacter succinogenes major paralogous domain-containing protein [Photobacterium sp. ZSDE20]MCQ1057652.1 fibrobacter succinogenes major paralogous domain-containing protein [Photobacterium sp. ZSDE20]MDD1821943.1 fibrobacter succinogenes major paralogous domain-containing protein [Photobacterium sp. ZSDE20]
MVLAATTSANDTNKTLYQLEDTDTVQDTEGNIYRTVTIGDQVWLAEGLRSTKFQDGSDVRSGAIPKDDEDNLLKYGRLYNWYDVADDRNLCPEGWRVATDEDWKTLERTIGMTEEELHQEGWRGGDQDLGLQLKEAQSDGPFKKVDQSLVNKHNFFARPAGVIWNGWYITEGAYTEFWTASSASENKGIIRTLAYSWWNAHKGEIRRATSSKDYMFSVRCVRDN